jgi:hypothetical protein
VRCNIRTRLAMRDATSGKKETNATKKYYLLQHQNKVTAMRDATSEKRD